MREIKSEQIKQIVKKAKTNLIIWLVVTLCGVGIFFLSFFMNDFKKTTDFHEILATGEEKENQTVSIEVSEQPYAFAYYPDDNSGRFYFLWDEKYIYVAFLSESEYERLNVEDIQTNHLKVTGVSKLIPSDIKTLALKAYNENVEEEYQLTSADFNDYFGVMYLDQTQSDSAESICLILGMLVSFVGFVMLISQIIIFSKLKSRMKKISDEDFEILNRELEEEESFYYKSAKLSLTKNYIVDFSRGLQVIKYSDILWMYKYEYRYNGINTQLSIIVYTNDKKRHVIGTVVGYTKKGKEINKEIMESIMSKNPNMIVGYNKENRQLMKEQYQIKA